MSSLISSGHEVMAKNSTAHHRSFFCAVFTL